MTTLKKQIEAGAYPGIVKTTLDGVDQRDYLEGKTEKSARDTFFYYTGAQPSAVRYKNWKIYFTMVPDTAAGALFGRHTLSLGPGRKHQARSLRDDRRCRQTKTLLGYRRRAGRSEHRLHLQLEHAADRPGAVAEGARVLRGVPADAGSGELQPDQVLEQVKKMGTTTRASNVAMPERAAREGRPLSHSGPDDNV